MSSSSINSRFVLQVEMKPEKAWTYIPEWWERTLRLRNNMFSPWWSSWHSIAIWQAIDLGSTIWPFEPQQLIWILLCILLRKSCFDQFNHQLFCQGHIFNLLIWYLLLLISELRKSKRMNSFPFILIILLSDFQCYNPQLFYFQSIVQSSELI